MNCQYDDIGNPVWYFNSTSSGNIYTLTWANGRQLVSGDRSGTGFTYTYNADGLRTKKVVDGVTTEYYWAGSQLAMMIVNPDLPTKKVLKFYYDAEGRPMCLDFNGTVYLYITNLQGDVLALAAQYGEVIRYEYDAWGKPISTYYAATPYYDAMQYNPLRYRGYIYDNETGFYYLQSRYYDPVVGRFINADELIHNGFEFLGTNTYAYCINNPVNMVDITGNTPEYIYNQRGPIEGKDGDNISFFFGNIGDHGCGVVAAYNILLSKSSKIKFDKVKKDILWKYNGSLLFGYWGTNPISLANYMKSKFWFVSVSGPNTWLWGIKAELSEAVIVLIKWEDGGMHYIAGISTGNWSIGGSFKFYNSSLKTHARKSIDGKEMSIRDFLHYVESNGATPIMMISVSGKKGWW